MSISPFDNTRYWLLFFTTYYSFPLFSRCHGPRPPPNSEFTLKPKKKKSIHQSECTPGSVCPPCPELVWRSCLGQHIGTERMVRFSLLASKFHFSYMHTNRIKVSCVYQMVCSNRTQFSCENLCGNLLSCSNHYCTKTCHALKNLSATPIENERNESCEECYLPCQKVFYYTSISSFPLGILSFMFSSD